LLKLGKLLRVARLVRIIERYQEYLRVVWNIMGSWILSIAIFFLSHVIACLWYLLRATLMYKPKDLNRDWSPRFSTLWDKNGWIRAKTV
jgi:hypothetical protein